MAAATMPIKRLNQRFTAFLAGYVQADGFMSLVREWAGDDVIHGNTSGLDPPQIDAMSQWIMHDKILPGQSRRLLDRFADEQLSSLPDDEQEWLQRYVADRPSIFKVSNIVSNEGYEVHDLVGGGSFKGSRQNKFFEPHRGGGCCDTLDTGGCAR
jgi:hypothetical protein